MRKLRIQKLLRTGSTGSKEEKSDVVASVTVDNKPDFMDQHVDVTDLALATPRNTVQPTSEEIKQIDTWLHKLHCFSNHYPNGTFAEKLRRHGAPQWVCKRATEFACDACESRKPPQHETERRMSTRPNCGVKLA